jgi:hypothetical protein
VLEVGLRIVAPSSSRLPGSGRGDFRPKRVVWDALGSPGVPSDRQYRLPSHSFPLKAPPSTSVPGTTACRSVRPAPASARATDCLAVRLARNLVVDPRIAAPSWPTRLATRLGARCSARCPLAAVIDQKPAIAPESPGPWPPNQPHQPAIAPESAAPASHRPANRPHRPAIGPRIDRTGQPSPAESAHQPPIGPGPARPGIGASGPPPGRRGHHPDQQNSPKRPGKRFPEGFAKFCWSGWCPAGPPSGHSLAGWRPATRLQPAIGSPVRHRPPKNATPPRPRPTSSGSASARPHLTGPTSFGSASARPHLTGPGQPRPPHRDRPYRDRPYRDRPYRDRPYRDRPYRDRPCRDRTHHRDRPHPDRAGLLTDDPFEPLSVGQFSCGCAAEAEVCVQSVRNRFPNLLNGRAGT